MFRRRILSARIQGVLRRDHQQRLQAHPERRPRIAVAASRQLETRRRAGGPARGLGQESPVRENRRGLFGQEKSIGKTRYGR